MLKCGVRVRIGLPVWHLALVSSFSLCVSLLLHLYVVLCTAVRRILETQCSNRFAYVDYFAREQGKGLREVAHHSLHAHATRQHLYFCTGKLVSICTFELGLREVAHHSLHSTNTDEFTGTKVQILTRYCMRSRITACIRMRLVSICSRQYLYF